MRTSTILAGAVVLSGTLATVSAHATIYLGIQRPDSSTTVTNLGNDGGTGTIVFDDPSNGAFNIHIEAYGSGTGAGSQPQPNLFTNTLDIRSNASDPVRANFYISETGLTRVPNAFLLSYADLLAPTGAGVKESIYVSTATPESNSKFDISSPNARLLGSRTLSPGQTFSDWVLAPAALTGHTYSVTLVYEATFPGNTTLSASLSEQNAPEPASLALLGVGLAGLGVTRLGRRRL